MSLITLPILYVGMAYSRDLKIIRFKHTPFPWVLRFGAGK